MITAAVRMVVRGGIGARREPGWNREMRPLRARFKGGKRRPPAKQDAHPRRVWNPRAGLICLFLRRP
ncbi:hypothetical protein CO2235_230274 [Cupriavidus oxalaticus]|uniref:Uncharacterized protein n=1 Tax=Cupriavidus oxalaticus TaxID=96344 RepID=A0A976BDS5_9BURK|nr:hypothetical protein CO2235_230274 [Cupriavidus oxalaticus]